MAKTARKLYAHYLNGTPKSTATYQRLGGDLEEFTKTMNDEVEKTINILGETSIRITNGNAEASVEPYYADPTDPIYGLLQGIIEQRLELDDRNTDIVNVHGWETPDGDNYPAIKEDVAIEIVSDGGDTTGRQIPINIHYTGNLTIGAFNMTTKTFTVGTWSTSPLGGTFTAS